MTAEGSAHELMAVLDSMVNSVRRTSLRYATEGTEDKLETVLMCYTEGNPVSIACLLAQDDASAALTLTQEQMAELILGHVDSNMTGERPAVVVIGAQALTDAGLFFCVHGMTRCGAVLQSAFPLSNASGTMRLREEDLDKPMPILGNLASVVISRIYPSNR